MYLLGGKGGRCVRLTTLPPSCAAFMKSEYLNFLEPSGPLQACNGTAFIHITKLSSIEIFSPTNKIHWEVGQAKDLSAPLYMVKELNIPRPTSHSILFDGENISFDASLVIYINNTNIPPIMIINRIYETQNLLSLKTFCRCSLFPS